MEWDCGTIPGGVDWGYVQVEECGRVWHQLFPCSELLAHCKQGHSSMVFVAFLCTFCLLWLFWLETPSLLHVVLRGEGTGFYYMCAQHCVLLRCFACHGYTSPTSPLQTMQIMWNIISVLKDTNHLGLHTDCLSFVFLKKTNQGQLISHE